MMPVKGALRVIFNIYTAKAAEFVLEKANAKKQAPDGSLRSISPEPVTEKG